MHTMRRRGLALLLGAVILAALVPQPALADYYPSNLNLRTYTDSDGTMGIYVSWTPIPLAAGIRIYLNGEQVTTLPGTAGYYRDTDVAGRFDYVYRIGAIVDGTEYGSEIRYASESREIGTPVIIGLECDRGGYLPSVQIDVSCVPAEGANYYTLFGQEEGGSGFVPLASAIRAYSTRTNIDFAVAYGIPEGPRTYWFKVRAYDHYNVPGTHIYIIYSGPYSRIRAVTFYPLDLPDWRSLFDDPERYQRQSWFSALAGLFARGELPEDPELFSSQNLAALLDGVLAGERDTDAYRKLLGMMHPLGLALLASGLITPPDEEQKGKLTQLLTQANERFGNLSQSALQGEVPEGFQALLEELCGAMGILMLPGNPADGPSATLYDSRIPVMGPLYTDRAGMDSMLGVLRPGAQSQQEGSSGTAIDDDVAWSFPGLAQEMGGVVLDGIPSWSIKSVNASRKGAAIDDDVAWTIKCTGDSAALSYAFVLYKDGMAVHQSDFGGANTFTWRVRKPGTYFAVGLVTDGQNGQDMQSGDTIVAAPKTTKKPTTKTTPKPTAKPQEKPTGKPTDKPTEKPTDVPAINPDLNIKPPVVYVQTPLPPPVINKIPVKP